MPTDHTTQRDEMIEGAVHRALDALFGDMPVATLSRTAVETHLRAVAHEAATVATDMARLDLMDASAVAAELGVNRQRVWALAHSRGLGWHVGRDWLFTPAEVDAMRVRKPGRPRKE